MFCHPLGMGKSKIPEFRINAVYPFFKSFRSISALTIGLFNSTRIMGSIAKSSRTEIFILSIGLGNLSVATAILRSYNLIVMIIDYHINKKGCR